MNLDFVNFLLILLAYFYIAIMSSKELKKVIHHVVDELPENVLEEAYTFLQNLQQETTTPQVHQAQVKKILTEDHELLQKLAE